MKFYKIILNHNLVTYATTNSLKIIMSRQKIFFKKNYKKSEF